MGQSICQETKVDDIINRDIPDLAPPENVPEHVKDELGFIFIKKKGYSKRLFDLVLSLGIVAVLSPIMLSIALYIKIVSPGPVLFRQKRIGRGGIQFYCLKFRTMHQNADPSLHKNYLKILIDSSKTCSNPGQPMQKIVNDPRVYSGANFLRSAGLDELPQLFNVILGQMSLVGPRPPVPYEVSQYPNWYFSRFDVVPGLTGLWQVSGKNKLGCNEMIRLDIQYTMNRSFFLDCLILFKTPFVVISQIKDWFLQRVYSYKAESQIGGKSW